MRGLNGTRCVKLQSRARLLVLCSARLSCCTAGLHVGAYSTARRPGCVHWLWRMRDGLHNLWGIRPNWSTGPRASTMLPSCQFAMPGSHICRAGRHVRMLHHPAGVFDTAAQTPSHVQGHWQVSCASHDHLRAGVRAPGMRERRYNPWAVIHTLPQLMLAGIASAPAQQQSCQLLTACSAL